VDFGADYGQGNLPWAACVLIDLVQHEEGRDLRKHGDVESETVL
jgi:hypothetical protein